MFVRNVIHLSTYLLTYLLPYVAEPFLRSGQLCSHSRTSQHFMQPECSLPCSQESSFSLFLFYGKEFLVPRPAPKQEDHPLSSVRDCLFDIFAATLHIWRPSPPSATCGRAMAFLTKDPPNMDICQQDSIISHTLIPWRWRWHILPKCRFNISEDSHYYNNYLENLKFEAWTWVLKK
jgi:hypothetical protein